MLYLAYTGLLKIGPRMCNEFRWKSQFFGQGLFGENAKVPILDKPVKYAAYSLNSFYLGEIQFHQVIWHFTKMITISPRVFAFHQESCALGEKFFTKILTKMGGPEFLVWLV